MALVTRIGASNANSFVTLDQADSILEDLSRWGAIGDIATWRALTSEQKEYRLIMAAQAIALLPLRGRKVYKDQALAFPRTRLVTGVDSDTSLESYSYSTDSVWYRIKDDSWIPEEDSRRVPPEVKEAQCQLAFTVIHASLASGGGSIGQYMSAIRSVSIGPLSVSLDYNINSGNTFDKMWRSFQGFVYLKLKSWISQFRGGAIRAVSDKDFWEECETLPTTTTTTTTTSTYSTTSSSSSTSSTISTTSSTTTTAP